MATNIKYASQSDLQNYFNRFGDFDQKTQIYGWTKATDLDAGTSGTDDLDLYYSADTGLVSELFYDGSEASKITFPTSAHCLTNGSTTAATTTMTVDAGHSIEAGDILKVADEYMYVVSISTNDLGVVRGFMNTTQMVIPNDTNVFLVIDLNNYGVSGTTSSSTPIFFTYDSDMNTVLLVNDGGDGTTDNVNDHIIESGVDFATYIDQQLVNASLELNNLLDARFPMPLEKAKQIDIDTAVGSVAEEYDPIIIKATCYITAANLIRSKMANDTDADYYYGLVSNAEGTGIVDLLNAGKIKLSFEVSNKSSKGSIRYRAVLGTMDIVELYGDYKGEKYDLLKVEIIATGPYGTGTFSVHYQSNNQIFGALTSAVKITGGLQHIFGGLYGRFQGASATDGDIWEIEVYDDSVETTNTVTDTIQLHR